MPIISPKLRLPCGGQQQLNKLWLGSCVQNNTTSESVKIMYNTTLVKDPSGVGYTVPYPVAEQNTAPDCSPYNNGGCPDNPCYVCGDFGVTNQNTPCWNGFLGTYYKTCDAGNTTVVLPGYNDGFGGSYTNPFFNCFSQSNDTKSFDACHIKFGRKNIYASKAWNGQKPITWEAYHNPTLSDCCFSCIYAPPQPTPVSQTKYLGIQATSVFSYFNNPATITPTMAPDICCPDTSLTCAPPCSSPDGGVTCCCPASCYTYTHTPSTITANASNNVSIDVYGNVTIHSAASSSSDQAFYAEEAFNNLGNGLFTLSDLIGVYLNFYSEAGPEEAAGAWVQTECSAVGSVISAAWNATYSDLDACGNITATVSYEVLRITLDLVNYTLDIAQNAAIRIPPACDSDGVQYQVVAQIREHYGATETTFNWTRDISGISTVSFEATQHEEVNGSLYSPYTAQAVQDDVNGLLSHYPLDDDVLLPWQLTYVGGPYLHHDEGAGVVPPFPSSNVIAQQYSGDIIGLPAPKGVDHIWSTQHLNYCICDSLVQPGNLIFFVRDHGAYSSNIDINAPCATEWLNVFQQSNVPQEAFMMMNQMFTVPSEAETPAQIFDDVLWASKYAVTIIPNKQSFNFSRPNAADRFYPTSSGFAVVGFDTGSGVISVDSTPFISPTITDINTGDYIWVCGVDSASIDGCYKVASVGPYTITVANQVATASALPYTIIEACGTGVVAKLRWQPPLKPAINGRIAISSVTNHKPITCSLQDPSWLVNDDPITIVGATGSCINGNWTVRVLDNETIVLNGSDGTGCTAYQGGGQMFSQGAADWAFSDVTSKNQFTVYQFGHDFRSVLDYNRLVDQSNTLAEGFTCEPYPIIPTIPCFNPAVPPFPRPSQGSCGLGYEISVLNISTSCVPQTHCGNAVAFFSPNNETFGGHGMNFGWFRNQLLDSEYGNLTQSCVRQIMNDLYFMPPPCPPEFNVTDGAFECDFQWVAEPLGECINDDNLDFPPVKFFAAPAIFEAVAELPYNSVFGGYPPPLTTGDGCGFLGCLTIAQLNSPMSCSIPGNVCTPPDFFAPDVMNQGEICPAQNATDLYHVWESDIITWLNMYFCVCNGGRSDVITRYIQNGFVCNNVTTQ